ncbi:MAG: hypothetical protein WA704_14785 [Pseudolabrys sp.]|jgi:hypothetical protein
MRQRGRRSAAAEEVISVDGRSPPLQPPRYLNKAEKQVFAELAATRHFVPTDSGLLASLAQATVMARRAARDPANSAAWERSVKVQAMLSTKLRLTPQARTDPKTVGRRQDRFYPAQWEWPHENTRPKGGALD